MEEKFELSALPGLTHKALFIGAKSELEHAAREHVTSINAKKLVDLLYALIECDKYSDDTYAEAYDLSGLQDWVLKIMSIGFRELRRYGTEDDENLKKLLFSLKDEQYKRPMLREI